MHGWIRLAAYFQGVISISPNKIVVMSCLNPLLFTITTRQFILLVQLEGLFRIVKILWHEYYIPLEPSFAELFLQLLRFSQQNSCLVKSDNFWVPIARPYFASLAVLLGMVRRMENYLKRVIGTVTLVFPCAFKTGILILETKFSHAIPFHSTMTVARPQSHAIRPIQRFVCGC